MSPILQVHPALPAAAFCDLVSATCDYRKEALKKYWNYKSFCCHESFLFHQSLQNLNNLTKALHFRFFSLPISAPPSGDGEETWACAIKEANEHKARCVSERKVTTATSSGGSALASTKWWVSLCRSIAFHEVENFCCTGSNITFSRDFGQTFSSGRIFTAILKRSLKHSDHFEFVAPRWWGWWQRSGSIRLNCHRVRMLAKKWIQTNKNWFM